MITKFSIDEAGVLTLSMELDVSARVNEKGTSAKNIMAGVFQDVMEAFSRESRNIQAGATDAQKLSEKKAAELAAIEAKYAKESPVAADVVSVMTTLDAKIEAEKVAKAEEANPK
jgi:hypothetical protein